jgi:hypothetical protein
LLTIVFWNSKAIDSEVEYRNSNVPYKELTEGENDFTETAKCTQPWESKSLK